MRPRVAAIIAFLCAVTGLVLIAWMLVQKLPWDLVVLGLLVLAVVAGWQGLVRDGRGRIVSWTIAVVLLVAAIVWMIVDGLQVAGVLGVLLFTTGAIVSKQAFRVHVHRPPAEPPSRPALVYNAKSGGGKAVSNNLAAEAERRGILARELVPGEDWEQVVRGLVADGADGLMAAGGDGTQALVATIAAEHDLPFACIPAGTRNHFALDLGVDRDDVVGALDAFVDGWEKRVDLGEVSGRTFVNNVSLGVYAEAVQQEGYREAKLRTMLATAPQTMGSGTDEPGTLRWVGADGTEQRAPAVILVSNNTYRLGRLVGTGTRPRTDEGVLGIAVMGATHEGGRRHLLSQWQATEFTVDSDSEIPVGLDGEALMLTAPVTFRIRPGVLRVRISPRHPGASPSSTLPAHPFEGLARLARMSLGREPT